MVREFLGDVLVLFFVHIDAHRRPEVAHVGAVFEELLEDRLLDFILVHVVEFDVLETGFEEVFARRLIALLLDVADVDAVTVVL